MVTRMCTPHRRRRAIYYATRLHGCSTRTRKCTVALREFIGGVTPMTNMRGYRRVEEAERSV
ncbi:hypothetical protein PAXINDRAFT_167037, partial [Paxillus involutus ATCC 200175]